MSFLSTIIKFSLLASLVLFFAEVSHAQSWELLLRESDSLAEVQNFNSAVITGELALMAAIEEHGQTDSVVAYILQKLGDHSYDAADFESSRSYYSRALGMRIDIFGESHLQVASSLNSLAILLSYLEELDSAKVLYSRAMTLLEEHLGPEAPKIAAVLNNVAMILSKEGKYAEASSMYQRAIDIVENSEEPNARALGYYRNNLAIIYLNQQNYEKAAIIYEELVKMFEQEYGANNVNLTTYLSNLAITYVRSGKYSRAEPILRRTLALSKDKLGLKHTRTALCIQNLAGCLYQLKNYDESETLFREALSLREEILGFKHPLTSKSAIALCGMLMETGKLIEAGKIFEERFGIDRLASLGTSPVEAKYMFEYSRYLRLTNQNDKALEVAHIGFETIINHFHENSWPLPEQDALRFANLSRTAGNKCISIFMDLERPNAKQIELAGNVILKNKGQVSDEIIERSRQLNLSSDSILSELVSRYKEERRYLSQLYIRGSDQHDIAEFNNLIDSLNSSVLMTESQLARQSGSFRSHQDARNVNVDRIKSLLPTNTVLVEYFKYDYWQSNPKESIPHYLVSVLDDGKLTEIIDLGAAEVIDRLVLDYREHMLRMSSAKHAPLTKDSREYASIVQGIYDLVMQPISNYLSRGDLIMVSPDGALNMVSFAGLIDSNGVYLIESNPIHYLSSGRELIRMQEPFSVGQGLLALGDPDYNATALERSQDLGAQEFASLASEDGNIRNLRSGCDYFKGARLKRLPATERELDLIIEGWRHSSGEDAIAFKGPFATEEVVKEKAKGKRVLHLATHGYYLSEQCLPAQDSNAQLDPHSTNAGENPLLLSGLFLAGANLQGEDADKIGVEDGILTAYEVSALDLSGVQMVVLSACESGLGEVHEGEGVYGLRRAFQVAGARTIVSALWSVPDRTTATLMSELYSANGETLPDKFRRIQLNRISTLRDQKLADHPYSWAAFIAMGDWQ